jgi:DNA primase
METNYITKREWINIFPEAISYLEQSLIDQTEKLDKLSKEYSDQLDRINKIKDETTRAFLETFADVFTGEDIKETEQRIKTINQYLQSDQPEQPGKITDNDIERAKSYPFSQLIETKRGFAKCPFHQEKTASFYINKKKNYGKCFGCLWCGDTIQFLMDTENITFIQAVKRLK